MTQRLDNPLQARLDALPDNDDWAVGAATLLLDAARAAGCSDLHLACTRDAVIARGRRDGTIVPLARMTLHHRDTLIARLKVLARLPAFVRHEPQDGRIEHRRPDSPDPLMLRVSFLPTIHGESVVIRFPDRDAALLDLSGLGMTPEVYAAVEGLLARQEGTLVLTGPSSSGKTTTIYAMLRHLHERRGDRIHAVTIEDPVERDLGFVSQVQVDPQHGLTFDRALRAAVRQDPNVLVIGEVRDAETARISIQAGMTGHLVITTLHAGRAGRVFTRLLSMGLEPYLVASAMTGAIAQRLARLLCPACRHRDGDTPWQTAEGCPECALTGHAGRTGIFEIVTVDEPLRDLILARDSAGRIAAEAARRATGDINRDLADLARRGLISRAEHDYLTAGEEDDTNGR